MHASLLENFERQRGYYESAGIVTSITKEGVWTIDGIDFPFVDQESKSRGAHSCYRFFFRPFHKVFWLYGKIAGHKRRAYKDALKIVEGMKCVPSALATQD
jgi:hypothetical protein